MGRDHSCETCGRGGFNNDLDCICDDFVPRSDLAKAVEGLRKIAAWIERERDEKDLRLRDIHDLARSILAEIEGENDG